MSLIYTEMAERAVSRYEFFLDVLRSQADIVMRRGPLNEGFRSEAIATSQDSARAFLSAEQAQLNDDTANTARSAHARALTDLELSPSVIEDRFADFIFQSSFYTTRLLAAQAERDIAALSQSMLIAAQRVDMDMRSGGRSEASAEVSSWWRSRTLNPITLVSAASFHSPRGTLRTPASTKSATRFFILARTPF